MKDRLINFLFAALIVHLIVAVFIIVDLPVLRNFRPLVIYRTYLLPGPFFSDTKIVDNRSLNVSWKLNGRWSKSIDPAKESFNQYHLSLNPTALYRTRINRSIQAMLTDSTDTGGVREKEIVILKQFLYDHYVPEEADSIRIRIVNKRAGNFNIRRDSLDIIFLE